MNAIERLRTRKQWNLVDMEPLLQDLDALYQAAKELVRDGHQSYDNSMYYIASNADAEDLAAAVRQVDGE